MTSIECMWETKSQSVLATSHDNTLHTPVATECEIGMAVQKIVQHKAPHPHFSFTLKRCSSKKETWPLIKRGYESTLRNKCFSNSAVTPLPNTCKSRNKALHPVHACNKCEHGNYSKFHCPAASLPTHVVCAMLMPSALNERERERRICAALLVGAGALGTSVWLPAKVAHCWRWSKEIFLRNCNGTSKQNE